MKGITKEEWPVIVKKLSSGALPVPAGLISDYDNWLCRSYAGRTLYIMDDIENALMVLATVLDVEPNLDDKPVDGFSETEHKVLCLLTMADIIWTLAKNADAAVRYVDEAAELCQKFTGEFLVTGWEECQVKRWDILFQMGASGAEVELKKAKLAVKPKKVREQLDINEVRRRQCNKPFMGKIEL